MGTHSEECACGVRVSNQVQLRCLSEGVSGLHLLRAYVEQGNAKAVWVLLDEQQIQQHLHQVKA